MASFTSFARAFLGTIHCPAVHVYMHERVPEQYGPPTMICNRFNRWSNAGHWDRIMETVADAHNVDMVMVDGTSVRAHHSATTLKKTTRVVTSSAREAA